MALAGERAKGATVWLLRVVVLAAAYAVAARGGLMLSFFHANVSPIWPASGLALAVLLRWGMGLWPAVAIGAALVTWSTGAGLMPAVLIAFGNTCEALLGVALLRRAGFDPALSRIDHVLILVLVAMAAPLPAAAVGAAGLIGAYQDEGHRFIELVAVWWVSDAMGTLLAAPVLLVWSSPRPVGCPCARRWEWGAMLAATVGATLLCFTPLLAGMPEFRLTFLLFPPLVWAALRAGPRAASVAVALVAGGAIIATTAGVSSLAGDRPVVRLVLLELLLASLATTILTLAAAVCGCHRLIADLDVAVRRAEEASVDKSLFVATIRHDLAHPLQAAELFLGSMRRHPLSPFSRQTLDRLGRALEAMDGILNNLREVTALEAGGMKPELATVALSDVLEQAADECRVMAETKGLAFRYVPCSLRVRTDPVLLGRIMRNLLANAVRYTETGVVLLGCRRQAGGVRIEVWDTGRGIPPAAGETIFREWHRIGSRNGDSEGLGLGLGLAIVTRLCHVLGITVDYRSSPDAGTVFRLVLPEAEG